SQKDAGRQNAHCLMGDRIVEDEPLRPFGNGWRCRQGLFGAYLLVKHGSMGRKGTRARRRDNVGNPDRVPDINSPLAKIAFRSAFTSRAAAQGGGPEQGAVMRSRVRSPKDKELRKAQGWVKSLASGLWAGGTLVTQSGFLLAATRYLVVGCQVELWEAS